MSMPNKSDIVSAIKDQNSYSSSFKNNDKLSPEL